MDKGIYIERRGAEDNLYYRLQQESVRMLQELCGELWTDYNAHDPGVTILDLVNTALTELDYQLSFPLADYLVDPQSGKIPFEWMGLLPFDELFRDSVVTAGDYEKLIRENIPGITECRVSFVRGRYDFVLYPDRRTGDHDSLIKQAEQLYQRHRNLCETLGSIRIGETLPEEKQSPSDECPQREIASRSVGVFRDILTYHSVQSDFPECYGVGPRGVPRGTSDVNKARIRQFQAYLLIFDHLVAGAGLQASGVGSKLILSGNIRPDTWPEIGTDSAEQLTDRRKQASLPHGADSFSVQQRMEWFGTLDMLYGEETEKYSATLSDPRTNLEKRSELIRLLPYLNQIRSRAVDLTDSRSVSALRRWTAAVSGEESPQERPLANLFSRYRLKLVADSLMFRSYRPSLPAEFVFGESDRNWEGSALEPIVFPEVDPTEADFQNFRTNRELFSHPVLPESLILSGRNADGYRSVRLRDREGYLLVWQHPGLKKWLNLGFFPTREALEHAAAILGAFLEYLHGECDTFYLVEHPLLYPEAEIPEEALHRISILLPTWTVKNQQRDVHENQLRERLPAHITTGFHWLPPDQWFYLEKLYFDWRHAQADNDGERIRKAAEELRIYLKYTS